MYKNRTGFEGSSKQILCSWLWNSALHSQRRQDGLKLCVLLDEQDTLQSFASLALPSPSPGRNPHHEDWLLSSMWGRERPRGKLLIPSQDLLYQETERSAPYSLHSHTLLPGLQPRSRGPKRCGK